MKRIICSLTLFCSLNGFCQDTSGTGFYFGLKVTEIMSFGLNGLNDDLLDAGLEEMVLAGSGGGAYILKPYNRWDLAFDFTGYALTNRVQKPATRVLLNCYYFDINVGYNFLGSSMRTRFGPVIGAGLDITQLIVENHDTLITAGELFNGAQNMYFEQPNLGFIVNGGLRFSGAITRDEAVYCVTQLSYFARLNPYDWSVPGFRLERLSGLNFSLGLAFRFRHS